MRKPFVAAVATLLMTLAHADDRARADAASAAPSGTAAVTPEAEPKGKPESAGTMGAGRKDPAAKGPGAKAQAKGARPAEQGKAKAGTAAPAQESAKPCVEVKPCPIE